MEQMDYGAVLPPSQMVFFQSLFKPQQCLWNVFTGKSLCFSSNLLQLGCESSKAQVASLQPLKLWNILKQQSSMCYWAKVKCPMYYKAFLEYRGDSGELLTSEMTEETTMGTWSVAISSMGRKHKGKRSTTFQLFHPMLPAVHVLCFLFSLK